MTLAVLVPVLGTVTETFVRRHVRDLHERTVVVTRRRASPAERAWDAAGPVLELDVLNDSWCGPLEQAAVSRFLAEHDVDVVLAEFLDVWLGLVPALLATGARVWGHGFGYDVSSRLLDPWWREQYVAWSQAAGVITVSEVSRRRLAEVGLDDVAVVPCGVDVSMTGRLRSRTAGCTVLSAGRLVAKKAPLVTVRAFALSARTRPGLRLLMVGDGPLRAEVQAAAGPAVQLLGAVSHLRLADLMREADVFVQHSVVDEDTGDEEGLPVAVLEAMAAALPVVATRHAGLPEAVLHEQTGLLVDEHDTGATAAALARLADDPELRLRLGAAGHARARSHYSWGLERERLRALLEL